MSKSSLGDFAVNSESSKTQYAGGLSFEELKKKSEKIKIDKETIVKDPSINNVIPIQFNSDGSLKYTFDNIYENKQLAAVAKDYYKNRDDVNLSDNEAIKKFISDRTWNQANTYQMGKEFLYITGDSVGEDQKSL